MSDTVVVISKVLPVIFLILTGNVMQRLKFIKQNTVDELKKIVVNVALPALLFQAFAETAFESKYLLIFLSVFLTCGLMLFLGILFKPLFKSGNIYFPTIFSGFETGMMGYSIFVAVYGAANMYKLAVVDLGQVTFVFFVLVSYLQKLNGKSATIKELTLSFIKSPVILSIITGIIVGSTGWIGAVKAFPVSNSLLEMLKLLSSLTVPVICLVIGYELHIDLKNIRRPLMAALLRVLLLTAFAYVINTFLISRLLKLDDIFKIAVYTMFLLPPPFVIPIFMEDNEEKNKQFILNTISIGIVLSLVMFLVMILII